jgi:hypothetical protein
VGGAIPVVGNLVGGIVGGVIGLVGGLLKSKKHYNLYYWNNDSAAWIFVVEGHPDEINRTQKEYVAAGYETQVVRNKNKTAKTPTDPPASYAAYSKKKSIKVFVWIAAGLAAAAAIWFALKGRRRG